MTEEDEVAARTQEILEKVDREVARRKAATAVAAAEPAPAEPTPAAEPVAEVPPLDVGPFTAFTETAPIAPEPVVAPVVTVSAPIAPLVARPISVPVPVDSVAPTAPTTPEELASGIAAARRRLAIVSAQLDDLSTTVAHLAANVPGGVEALPGAPLTRRLGPPPPAMAPIPLAPTPEPEPEPVIEPEVEVEPDPYVEPFDEVPAALPLPGIRAPVGGMSVRPRPPVQHHRTVSELEQARLVAVELAVQGHPRGAVGEVLRDEFGLEDLDAVLDPLFGPGTPPDALMIRG